MKRTRSYNQSSRSGLTLIEVVAAVSLASMAIVMVLNAVVHHQQQVRRAAERKQAAQLTDQLIAGWFADKDGIPRVADGHFEGTDFVWNVRPVSSGVDKNGFRFEKIKVNVINAHRPGFTLIELELARLPNDHERYVR